uniref:Pectinesterase n=1 Tax=Anthurium amnicola TaxID=1678845 RepID=A0A1D1ZDH9_9ARAE
MNYGRLGSPESIPSVSDIPFQTQQQQQPRNHGSGKRRRALLLLGLFAAFFLVASGGSLAFLLRSRWTAARSGAAPGHRRPTQAISRACGQTRYPNLCVRSLVGFPGALDAGERDLVHVSVNMTLQRVSKALYGSSAIANVRMGTRLRTAYEDCMELLDDSVDHLSRSLAAVTGAGQRGTGASDADVLTWLSGALTDHDTCTEGLDGVPGGYVKDQIGAHLKDLTQLVSNCLAIFAVSSKNKDFSGIPIQNRRLLSSGDADGLFPAWMARKDRRLLQVPASTIQADIVVSKEANATYKTIEQAVKAAPEYSARRFIIHIKAGRYDENIKVGRKKTNLMFMGDGKSVTIVAGSRSVSDNFTTFRTATFAATGAGFIARDITFQNWAGPERHQAVALRVGADHAVVYRCNVIGYQDSLYVHSQRQFFRECDIYGTVDFVFGNAAVVLQNCSLYARKPLPTQKNTITAQNRKDPNQNTGISIHDCRVLPTPDLEATKSIYPTYLGRPWKLYSRAVYMMSYMSDHVHPDGWLPWNTSNFALDTLYYGEYMNYGPGGAVGKRVTWPGFRVITLPDEASKFTVAQFIYGSSWLPSTGVAFLAGLSV